jgi:rhomboid protease GluP
MITGRPTSLAFVVTVATLFVMVLFSQFYWHDPFGWSHFLPAANNQIFNHGQVWRIFTAVFIHSDFGHLASNMFMLCIFCFFITSYFGLSVYPLLAFIFAGVVNLVAIASYEADVRLLGASGLVYLLGGFWLTMYFLIQRQYRILNRSLRVLGVGLVVFFPTSFVPTTSYRTHAIGIGFGILMALIYFYKNKALIRSHEVYKMQYIEALDH